MTDTPIPPPPAPSRGFVVGLRPDLWLAPPVLGMAAATVLWAAGFYTRANPPAALLEAAAACLIVGYGVQIAARATDLQGRIYNPGRLTARTAPLGLALAAILAWIVPQAGPALVAHGVDPRNPVARSFASAATFFGWTPKPVLEPTAGDTLIVKPNQIIRGVFGLFDAAGNARPYVQANTRPYAGGSRFFVIETKKYNYGGGPNPTSVLALNPLDPVTGRPEIDRQTGKAIVVYANPPSTSILIERPATNR